jgi:sodium/hydrogen antiporter
MSEYPIFIFISLLILGYGLFSKIAEKSVVTAPMVFVVVGLLTWVFKGDFLRAGVDAPLVKIVAEITLILILFVDASTINIRLLLRERKLPLRLLLIGLPLTMVSGILIAIPFFPGANIWVLALMALILSPTDAALGQAVVTSKFIPEKIRQTINVESGLNDGIALPPILVCIAILSSTSHAASGLSYWILFTLKQFLLGPLLGGLIGWLGGRLVEWASKRSWMNLTFQRLAAVTLAFLAYSFAELVHGNGFIAAFFAGLLIGTTSEGIRERIHEFGEAESQALVLFIFFLFGMILVPLAIPYWDLAAVGYSILSLTVIRMIPAGLSLLGCGLSWGDIGFIGWFGPRGIASILYLLLVVIEVGVTGIQPYLAVIIFTVFLSVILHGITANPLSRLYNKNSSFSN